MAGRLMIPDGLLGLSLRRAGDEWPGFSRRPE